MKKQVTTAPQRNARGQWVKGISGNDHGRPRTALAELCREQVTKLGLVRVLGNIAARTGDYGGKKKVQVTVSDQVQAIKLLLLYGFGAPKNEIDNGEVRIEVSYADHRQVNIAHAAPGTGADHSRGEEIQHRLLRSPVREDDAGPGQADTSGVEG